MPAEEQNISTLKEPHVASAVRGEEEKDLITWTAPARPFKRRNREFWVTAIAIAAVVGLVLFLVEGFMPVLLIISVVFLFYVLSTVEPENIEYKVTTRGIKVADKRTDWEIMGRFWTTRRFDSELLVVEIGVLPGRLEIVIKPEIKEELKKVLGKYLVYEEIPGSGIDRVANWFGKKMPGNR